MQGPTGYIDDNHFELKLSARLESENDSTTANGMKGPHGLGW